MKGNLKRVLCLALAVAMVISVDQLSALSALAASKTHGYTDPGTGDEVRVVAEKSYTLVSGVTETDIVLNDKSGDAQVKGFMTTISPDANVSLKATYTGYYDSAKYDKSTGKSNWNVGEWDLSTTTKQAAVYEKTTGENVIFATNGDYFNMQTGQPSGVLVINGNNCNPAKKKAEPYFAVLKDGSYAFREAGESLDDVAQAVSGPFYLVKDGQNVCNPGFKDLYPVNSVGMKADGSIVFFMADGRQYPNSVGMSQYEQAQFLVEQGVVTALYMDGGGSATVVTQREGESELKIRNTPSDGSERSISSGFILVANATSDGVFDHVTVTPNAEKYTLGSQIQFSASGVDAAGGSAELPEGITWEVVKGLQGMVDNTVGTIDENGLFTASKAGEATVNALYDGKVVGSATVTITEPDNIYFNSASVSLDFGEKSDLGLVVREDNVDVNYKAGDFTWTIKSNTEGVSDEQIGTMDGNTFVAGTSNSTIIGTVSVSYKRADGRVIESSVAVEIGKLPVVAFDFEPDSNGNKLEGAHYHWGKNTYVNAGVTDGYYGKFDTLTVPVSNTYSAVKETVYATLTAPYSFTGNYDSSVPAAEIFKRNGYTFYLWPNNSITTYNAGSVTTTTAAEGGQVRYGDYSLEINYDYASYNGSSNSNYYVRYCGEPYDVEGQPTQLGMWVYADAETYNLKGYLLYADVAVFNGSSYSTKNMPLVHDVIDETGAVVQSGEIDWVGWKYCYTDLSSLAAYYSPEHPYKIRTGEGMIWLSYQPKKGGGRYNGTIYVDNYRFVYGTDLDDLDNPEITKVSINDQVITSSATAQVEENSIEITANFRDIDGKNVSGIDGTATSFVIDGDEVTCDGDALSATTRVELANGLHSVKVTVYDKFGNYASETYYFQIGEEENFVTAKLSGPETVTMGVDYALELTTKGQVKSFEMDVIQMNSDFGEPDVVFADGWSGEVVYTITGFKKAKMNIKAEYVGEGEIPADASVGTIKFSVPTTMDPAIDFFTYQVTSVKNVLADGTKTTNAQEKVVISLSAYYSIDVTVPVQGQETVFTVKNPEDQACAGVTLVYGNESATTDENGQVKVVFNDAPGTVISYSAKDANGLVSFTEKLTVLADSADATGAPVGLSNISSKNGATEQTVSWFANVASSQAKAIVRFSESANDSGLVNPVEVEGKSVVQNFNTSKGAARINAVKLTGLEPGKTYFYQAGDGNTWSELKEFTTSYVDNSTKFFVLGDTQMSGSASADAAEIALLNKVAALVKGYDFGIQTGDYVDNGGNYPMWAELQEEFGSAFDGIDMIHTMGNHEYYGDDLGVAASAIFNLEGKEADYYSVEYDNVYVAVINYNSNLSEALAWMVEDAKASKATWKVLSVHQPAYYTNVNGGSERFNKNVPAAAEAAGIDMVFSGHDHSYARTMPMIGGQVDEANGTTYFICGDLGEKSRNINYAATNTEAFNFACISQDYSAIVLTVEATEDTLTAVARDADGNIIDSYTKKACNHEDTVEYRDGKLVCANCGADLNMEEYVGFVTGFDKDNNAKTMFFFDGKPVTGWYLYFDEYYYFDEDGFGLDGECEIEGLPYTFKDGKLIEGYTGLVDKKGSKYFYDNGILATGWRELDGNWYYCASGANKGKVSIGEKKIGVATYTFNENGVLIRGGFRDYRGYVYYYWAGNYTTGWQTVDGNKYYFSEKGRMKTGFVEIDGKTYEFAENGILLGEKALNGFVEKSNGKYYYVNNVAQSGWQQVDGNWYYCETGYYLGRVKTGEYKTSIATYTFDENGILVKGGFRDYNGYRYYYWAGKYQTGWQQIDGTEYYFDSKGRMKTGIVEIEGKYYEFADNGALVGEYVPDGFVKNTDGIYYYENGAVKTGWFSVGDNWYFGSTAASSLGKLRTGVSKVNSATYTFDENGVLVQGGFVVKEDGIYYYFAGQKVKGWVEHDAQTYYFDKAGRMVTGIVTIDGVDYSFDENGVCLGQYVPVEASEEEEPVETPTEE